MTSLKGRHSREGGQRMANAVYKPASNSPERLIYKKMRAASTNPKTAKPVMSRQALSTIRHVLSCDALRISERPVARFTWMINPNGPCGFQVSDYANQEL